MKKLILILLITGIVFSCNDRLEDLNRPRKKAEQVPAEPLFANGVREMFDLMTQTSVNVNVFRLYAQYWAQTTYPDESQYNMVNRLIPDNFWQAAYRDILMDLKTARQRVEETADEINLPKEQMANQQAIIDVCMVYMYSVLVDAFGAIPYTEALNPEILTPKYDPGSEVYNNLIETLDAAIASLEANSGAPGFSENQDLVYKGDVAGWLKFANSVKVRLAINLSEVDEARAATMINEAIASGVIESKEENANIEYQSTAPNTNPVWEDLVQSGRRDFVVANTMVNTMTDLVDPRLPVYAQGLPIRLKEDKDGNKLDSVVTGPVTIYFAATDTLINVAEGEDTLINAAVSETQPQLYRGGVYGSGNAYSRFSRVGRIYHTPAIEGVLIDYSQVLFWLAEAASKGIALPSTAQEYYEKAVRESIAYWDERDERVTIFPADIDAYLKQPGVAYDAANWKQVLGTQQWLSQYNKPFEGWTTWRRLDFEGFNVPEGLSEADIPKRFIFPIKEATLNPTASKAAAQLVGGDNARNRVFWDVE